MYANISIEVEKQRRDRDKSKEEIEIAREIHRDRYIDRKDEIEFRKVSKRDLHIHIDELDALRISTSYGHQ
ncbi:hypothetical protein ACJX0J_022760 [Zea mays]